MSETTPTPLDSPVETWALEFPGRLSRVAVDALLAQLADLMPGKRVIVVQEGAHFRALEPLDATVADLEASLPTDWIYRLEGGLDHYHAVAYLRFDTGRCEGVGPTLAAAVRALTAKLQEAGHV
jgi:hypothetical protein